MVSAKSRKERQDKLELRIRAFSALKKETYGLLRFICLTSLSVVGIGVALYLATTAANALTGIADMFGRF